MMICISLWTSKRVQERLNSIPISVHMCELCKKYVTLLSLFLIEFVETLNFNTKRHTIRNMRPITPRFSMGKRFDQRRINKLPIYTTRGDYSKCQVNGWLRKTKRKWNKYYRQYPSRVWLIISYRLPGWSKYNLLGEIESQWRILSYADSILQCWLFRVEWYFCWNKLVVYTFFYQKNKDPWIGQEFGRDLEE